MEKPIVGVAPAGHSDLRVDQPPKIIDVTELGQPVRLERLEPSRAPGGPPVHPAAALLLLVVDNLWNLADWAVLDWFLTIPLSFLSVCVPVFFIQKLLKKNPPRRALGYALLLGIIAGVPFSVTGTPVGVALLAWSGISRLLGRPAGR